jgi:nitroreductase
MHNGDMSTSSDRTKSSAANRDESQDNAVVRCLMNRRSIRHFTSAPIPEDTIDILEAAAQHAATSQYLNSWSAVRIMDPSVQRQLADIGRQPYIAEAPLLYVYIVDQHRNARIAAEQGIDVESESFTLNSSYIFSQSQNDAVLALHAMETAANALGLGCVILGSLLNDIDRLISILKLPPLTFPVLGLAIGEPDQSPERKPRLPHNMQFFQDTYPDDRQWTSMAPALERFNDIVHRYYDLRDTSKPVASFSAQIARISTSPAPLRKCINHPAKRQGFTPDR